MDQTDLIKTNTAEITAGVHSGEYFREARSWYSAIYHTPLAERCYFIVVMLLALATTVIASLSVVNLLPLNPSVPFTIMSKNGLGEVPKIIGLAEPGEAENPALMRYFISNYVMLREGYDVEKLQLNVNTVKSQSAPDLYASYRNFMNPANPKSPITRYERHTRRDIKIADTTVRTLKKPMTATVVFDAIERSGSTQRKIRYQADITFRYSDLTVDQETYAVSPMGFQVTAYNVKPQGSE